jgi:hypothetical protein
VLDSDSHIVELPELWEKYLDPEYRTPSKHALGRHEGRTGADLKVNGEIFRDKGQLARLALVREGWTCSPSVPRVSTRAATAPTSASALATAKAMLKLPVAATT